VYFVEVKYRASPKQGSGIEYITPKKLKQMELAAEFWVADNSWDGDYNLGGIEVSGPNFEVTNFLPEL
jgi:Holliday junction resolvase-like predicted endonuclease